jgi:hypothetical protein
MPNSIFLRIQEFTNRSVIPLIIVLMSFGKHRMADWPDSEFTTCLFLHFRYIPSLIENLELP